MRDGQERRSKFNISLKEEYKTLVFLFSEHQEAEQRSMGLESKLTLDLKPSKDMIENRSIDIKLSNGKLTICGSHH